MNQNTRGRIIPTISNNAREHLLYVQEIGTLTSQSPHISTRNNIYSFLFLVVENGSGRFTYRNETNILKAGDCVFVDCHEPYSHESSGDDPWTLNWVHFYGKELEYIYRRYTSNGNSYIFHPSNLGDILSTLHALYSANETLSATTEIISNKYLTDLITAAFTVNSTTSEATDSTSDKLASIREYMQANFEKAITLDMLSDMFYISKYHLAREYKKLYGTTVIADLTAIRISQAKSMLRFSNTSIEEISTACGFSDSGYFIKVFSRLEGMTPLTYRKKW